MKNLVIETERAWLSLGNINYGTSESEKSSLKFRRSLYFTKDIKAGELITNQNLKIIYVTGNAADVPDKIGSIPAEPFNSLQEFA